MEIYNAKIIDTYIGYDDHGIFSVGVTLDAGYFCQGFGYRAGQERDIDLIKGIIRVVKADKWEQVKGRYVRIARDENRDIEAIGNIIDEDWVNITTLFEED